MKFFRSTASFVGSFLFACVPAVFAGGVFSSLEQFNYQNAASSLTLRSYDAFDELDSLPGVTSLSISVNGGTAEVINQNPEYDNAFKRRLSWSSVGEMVAARPVNATITHTLGGSPAGVVNIVSPGHAYADAIPVSPLFNIQFTGTGANATWVPNGQGQNILYFDPTHITSFTVTLNRYGASSRDGFVQGSHFATSLYVADVTGSYNTIGEQSNGGVLAGEPDVQYSATFTKGLALDAGDASPDTYGFGTNSFFNIEGEHANAFGLADAGLGQDHFKAFIYQNNTSLLIMATPAPIPEPAAAAAILGLFGLGLATIRRRR